MLDILHSYLDAGISIIPIQPKDKRPISGFMWEEFQNRRATHAEVAEWMQRFPNMNIGVVTGAASGRLGILDIDYEQAIPLLKKYGELPKTVTTSSGNGFHLWFRLPEGIDIGNKAGFIPGVDFRGFGGYVVAPPSIHPNGIPYKFVYGLEQGIQQIPAWLLELMEKRAELTPKKQCTHPMESQWYKGTEEISLCSECGAKVKTDEIDRKIEQIPVLFADKNQPKKPTGLVVKGGTSKEGKKLSYWKNAYTKELEILGSASSNRNATLNETTLKLFGLFYGYQLAGFETDINENQLIGLVQSTAQRLRAYDTQGNTFSDHEIDATMRSAMNAARQNPRDVSFLDEDDFIQTKTPIERAVEKSQHGEVFGGHYFVNEENQLCFSGEKKNFTICDFWAKIITQIVDEDDERYYEVELVTRYGEVNIDIISARDFSEDRKLKAFLENLAGAMHPIHQGMAKHLNTAIKLMSEGHANARRYHRTGWLPDGLFILPGSHENIICDIPARKLPYKWTSDVVSDELMSKVMRNLIESVGPERTIPGVLYMLLAPTAHQLGWRNKRFGYFIKGRTGNLKTSWIKAAMCLWGNDFQYDSSLIKWGEGATRNAMMQMAAATWDMPIVFDNFKPNTGNGPKDFVNLIHNIIEGGEKDRLNKSSKLQESKDLYAWPLCTGEDIPDNDPASLARLLVCEFDYKADGWNNELFYVQQNTSHLHACGMNWINWIQSDAGQKVIESQINNFDTKINAMSELIAENFPAMVNANRVAMNVAQLYVMYEIVLQHPVFGEIFQEYRPKFDVGLVAIIKTMVDATSNALEAQRFIDTVRELYASKRAYILYKDAGPRRTSELIEIVGQHGSFERVYQNTIGYYDQEAVYLIPGIARSFVERYMGREGLNSLTQRALYSQLVGLGMILKKGADQITYLTKIDGKPMRVLVLSKDKLLNQRAEDELL